MTMLLTETRMSPPADDPAVPRSITRRARRPRSAGTGRADAPESIVALFERAREDAPGALSELIRRSEPLVRSAARRHLGQGVDVDDVVQEVWVSLIRHLDRISSADALGGWLWVVASHAAIRQGKAAARLCPQGAEPQGASGSVAEDDTTTDLGPSGRQCVREALDRLKPEDRQLLQLLFATERPNYRVISRAVQRPIGSIGPTRQRLLNRLREDPTLQALR